MTRQPAIEAARNRGRARALAEMDLGSTEPSGLTDEFAGQTLDQAVEDLAGPDGIDDVRDAFIEGYEQKWDEKDILDEQHYVSCPTCSGTDDEPRPPLEEALENATVRALTMIVAFDREGADPDCVSVFEYVLLPERFTIIGWSERGIDIAGAIEP